MFTLIGALRRRVQSKRHNSADISVHVQFCKERHEVLRLGNMQSGSLSSFNDADAC